MEDKNMINNLLKELEEVKNNNNELNIMIGKIIGVIEEQNNRIDMLEKKLDNQSNQAPTTSLKNGEKKEVDLAAEIISKMIKG